MSHQDLESLISSTLTALEQKPVDDTVSFNPSVDTSTLVPADDDLDACLSRIRESAPQVADPSSSSKENDDPISSLLENLLTPDSILESMEALAAELEVYLESRMHLTDEDTLNYRKQLVIYKEVSLAYKASPNVAESETPDGERVRGLLDQLQGLGSPPEEVVEKLMSSQLGSLSESDDASLGKEFEQFLKDATKGGSLPGLTEEDESIIKRLSEDPNALKDLLGMTNTGKPGDCSIC